MAPVESASSAPTGNKWREKKAGVPSRDKLSRAIALVQSGRARLEAPPKLDLTNLPSEDTEDYDIVRSPMQHVQALSPRNQQFYSKQPTTSSTSSTLGNEFANDLYRAINQENEPSPRHRAPRPLTPRAAAAAAARKSKEQKAKALAKSPKTTSNSPINSPPLTPRAAAAAAITAEKRRARARKQKLDAMQITSHNPDLIEYAGGDAAKYPVFSRKLAEKALLSVNGGSNEGISGGSGSLRAKHLNPSGLYHWDSSYKSHQKDVEAAMKFSNDIEKDIEATSRTLAKISEFIDNASSMPKQEPTRRNSSIKYSFDGQTIDTCAAITEVVEAREPESAGYQRTEVYNRRDGHSSEKHWDQEMYAGAVIQNTRVIYGDNKNKFKPVAFSAPRHLAADSIAESNQTTFVYSLAVNMDQSPPVRKGISKTEEEYSKAKKEYKKQSGFEDLLNIASPPLLSDPYMRNYELWQTNGELEKSVKQPIPIQILSPEKIHSAGSKHQTGAHRDAPTEVGLRSRQPLPRRDPPNVAQQLDTMRTQGGLQPKEGRHFSFEPEDRSGQNFEDDDSLQTPKNPILLSQISAFIDKVEQKNQSGKKKPMKSVAGANEPLMEEADSSTFAKDFDAETLAHIFDQPLTPSSRRDKDGGKNKKKQDFIQQVGQKEKQAADQMEVHALIEKAKVNCAFSDTTTTIASQLPDKQSTWFEMETLLNHLSQQNRESTAGHPSCEATKINDDNKAGPETNCKQSSSKDDGASVDRGELIVQSKAKAVAWAQLKINDKPTRRQQLDPSIKSTTGFSIFASDEQQTTVRRGADPPTNADKVSRQKADPPAVVVAPHGSRSKPNSTPRNRILDEKLQANSTQRDNISRKPIEPSPKNSNAGFVDHIPLFSNNQSNRPLPNNIVFQTAEQTGAMFVDVQPGTEATPIFVESPTPKAMEKSEPLVVVDLTSVSSGDICKDVYEQRQDVNRKRKDPELDFSVQDNALKELLAIAETPRKPSKTSANHAFGNVLSANGKDGPSKLDASGAREEFGCGTRMQSTRLNKQDAPGTQAHSSDDKNNNAIENELPGNKVVISSRSTNAGGDSSQEDLNAGKKDTNGSTTGSTEEASISSREPVVGKSGTHPERIKADSDDDQTDHEDLLGLVGSQMSQIVSDDDHDPLQSFFFARNNDGLELASTRKEAGKSLIQLTLDEVKNFVDSKLFDNDGGVPKQRINELEQLHPSTPSLFTDLADEDAQDHIGCVSDGLELETPQDVQAAQADEEEDAVLGRSVNDDQAITVKYEFQPTSPELQDDCLTKEQRRARKKGKKKGLKRKLSSEVRIETSPPIETSYPKPSNWLASLDHIFSCRTEAKGKIVDVAEVSSGEVYQNSPSFSSSFDNSHFNPSSFDPHIQTRPSSQMLSREESDKGSILDGDDISTPSNLSQDSPKAGKDRNKLQQDQSVEYSRHYDSANSEQEITTVEKRESSAGENQEIVSTGGNEGSHDSPEEFTDAVHPTQRDSSPSSILQDEVSEKPRPKELEAIRVELMPAVHSLSSPKADNVDSSKTEVVESGYGNVEGNNQMQSAMAAAMVLSPSVSEMAFSPPGMTGQRNNEKATASVFDINLSDDTGMKSEDPLPPRAKNQQLKSPSRAPPASRVPPGKTTVKPNMKPALEAPNLLKFASQSDSSPDEEIPGPSIDDTLGNICKKTEVATPGMPHKLDFRMKAIDGQPQVAVGSSPNVDKHQSVTSGSKGACKQLDASVQQLLLLEVQASMEQPHEMHSDFISQASSMLGVSTSLSEQGQASPDSPVMSQASESVGWQPALNSRGTQRQSSTKAGQEDHDLLKFASQTDSFVDETLGGSGIAKSTILRVSPKPGGKKAVLLPRSNESPGEEAAQFELPRRKDAAPAPARLDEYEDNESAVDHLSDKYQVQLQTSSTTKCEDEEGLESLSDIKSPQHQAASAVAAEGEQTKNATQASESAKLSSGWEHFVDLTNLEQDDEQTEEKEGKTGQGNGNAWESSLNFGSLSEQSWSNNESTEINTRQEASRETETREPPQQLIRDDDSSPWMHQNKRFDFIEDVNEDDNIDAYFSRMNSLKQGGHLPNLKLDPYAERGQEGDSNDIEVDLDVGFVKKALAPILSEDEDEDEERVGPGNRYISLEESADEEDHHRKAINKPRLDTISDEEETSSYGGASDDDSIGSTADQPIVVHSSSTSDNGNDSVQVDDEKETEPDFFPEYSGESYESDNDEWLRKRDLATRKTQKPSKSWLTRTASGIQSKLSFVTVETPKAINGVAAAKKILCRQPKLRGGRRRNPIPSSKSWKLPYKERTKEHHGYFDVDFFSLFDSSAVGPRQRHPLDPAPWESRDVRQHFLHEHSIGFSKNWFGKAQRTRGNDRIKERVAHPKSMEMPMEAKPHPEEWTQEMYTTWKAPRYNYNSRSIASSYSNSRTDQEGTTVGSDSGRSDSGTLQDETSSFIEESVHSGSRLEGSSYSTASGGDFTEAEDEEYEDTPQCGTLINVKPKIGERVSRIHPDYTSQLRRSRWRKKYFPRGTFPYDK